jgi:hypothetical protein
VRAPWLAFVVFVIVLAIGAHARAAAPPEAAAQKLDAAEKAYVDLEYEKANKLADAVTKARGLSHEQLVLAYRILARTHAILGHKEEARDAFVALLTYSPDEKEDAGAPPKVTERQLEARGILSGYAAKPGIEVLAHVQNAKPALLRVTTRDPTHVVKRVAVGWRWGGGGPFTTSTVAVGADAAVDVSAPPAGVRRLDYYAQAFDERDDTVFEAGNPDSPRITFEAIPDRSEPPPLRATTPEKTTTRGGSVFASPVFWAIAGGVVLAGGIGVFAATRTSSPTQTSLSPSLTCGGGRC